jgi:predicted aldo/keto reductase-like oxidoreductase
MYNYMDTENQAGTEEVRYAAEKGLAVVVMEPLLGGRLARPPRAIREMFDVFDPESSPADWALRWVWNHREVAVVLSGMGRMSELEANLREADRASVGSLGPAEHELIGRVRQTYLGATPIPCTQCGYCLPCPNGLAIPRNFELYNNGRIHEDPGTSRMLYAHLMAEGERASACVQCSGCEEKCPQGISIREWLKKVHSVLGEGKPFS